MGKFRSVFVISLVVICLGLMPAFSVLAESRSPIVKFEGTITEQTSDGTVELWKVGDYTVQVDEGTVIVAAHGDAAVGAEVVVIARRGADDVLTAMVIRVLRGDKPERQVTIRGTVTEVAPDYIVVNGLQIQITQQTRIQGNLAEGEFVTVRARVQGSEITALQIQVRTRAENQVVEFVGEVEAIDETTGIWTIAGKAVMVDEDTEVRGEPEVGDMVAVRAQVQEDESLLAVHIWEMNQEVPQPEEVTFTGVIQRIAPNNTGRWVIGGQQVIVGPQTVINGTPEIGAEAEVTGLRVAEGAVAASEITISEAPEEMIFTGTVNKMPPGRPVGLWVIDTWRVVVVPDTAITGTPTVGATVQFAVRQRGNNGALVAVWIKVLDDVEPTVTPTEEPTIPPTVPADDEPTIAPEPDGTPEPDDEAKPSKADKLPKPPNGRGQKVR